MISRLIACWSFLYSIQRILSVVDPILAVQQDESQLYASAKETVLLCDTCAAEGQNRYIEEMALAQALSTIRSGVISNIRLPVGGLQAASGSLSGVFSRSFAEGTYLNKDDVTERVLSVVKNFDKADPAKVSHV